MNRQLSPDHLALPLWLRRCFQRLQARLSPGSKRRSRGQGMVEFALILPILLLVVVGIIEFSYIFAVYTGLFNAAREGARHGVVNPRDVSGIVSSAKDKVFLADPAQVNITVAYDKGPGTAVFTNTTEVQIGDRVLVQLDYDLETLTPVIQPFVSTLHVETESARTVVTLGEIGLALSLIHI